MARLEVTALGSTLPSGVRLCSDLGYVQGGDLYGVGKRTSSWPRYIKRGLAVQMGGGGLRPFSVSVMELARSEGTNLASD